MPDFRFIWAIHDIGSVDNQYGPSIEDPSRCIDGQEFLMPAVLEFLAASLVLAGGRAN